MVARVARILSLDVVLGACVSTWFVAKIAQVPLNIISTVALALCVWLIYTADHLRDAFRLSHEAHTPRHQFHQKYFRPIMAAFLLTAMAGAALLFYLPIPVVEWGLWLIGLVGLYFLVSQIAPVQLVMPKELMIALLYSSGIFLPIAAQLTTITPELVVLFIQYAALALMNLVIFSWYEHDSDQLDFAHSLATQYGKRRAKQLVMLCTAGIIVSVLWSGFLFSDDASFLFAQLLILMMTGLLLVILVRPRFFGQYERYRWFGDGVFLLPILMSLFAS